MSTRARNRTAIVAIVLGCVAGAYLYRFFDGRTATSLEDSMGWSSVTGLVTHSSLEEHYGNLSLQRDEAEYRVAVEYEYIVDDRRYVNNIVRFDQNSLSRTGKERLVSAHPVGRQVEVFYDPSNPKKSVLERDMPQH